MVKSKNLKFKFLYIDGRYIQSYYVYRIIVFNMNYFFLFNKSLTFRIFYRYIFIK